MERLYIYVGDPDTKYEVVCESKGAGGLRGEAFVTYRNVATGECYTRTKTDFEKRMVPQVNDVVY